MKEFLIRETYIDAQHHAEAVKEFLLEGFTIVSSGQMLDKDEDILYYTHLQREYEELEKK